MCCIYFDDSALAKEPLAKPKKLKNAEAKPAMFLSMDPRALAAALGRIRPTPNVIINMGIKK